MSKVIQQAPRVLSIQSHVVHGFVGNRCATFILELYGFNVDVINSVHFSNHTGYRTVKGTRLSPDELRAIFQGLMANDLCDYDYILTGYMGSGPLLQVVAEYVRLIKQKSPHIKYVCDPVIGDNKKLYVDQSCVDVYRTEILPLADIVTPNDFELEQLLGKSIDSYEGGENRESVIWQSMRSLHERGPTHIIVSSIPVHNKQNELSLQMMASSKIPNENQFARFHITFPYLTGSFTGTGDSFAALILAWFHRENSLVSACEHAISILHRILLNTIEIRPSINVHDTCGNEISLIESKQAIEDAEITFRAVQYE